MAIHWSQRLVDELALWFVVQHSVSAFTALMAHFGSADQALRASTTAWQSLRLHHAHAKKLQDWQQNPALASQFEQAIKSLDHAQDHVIALNDLHYPKQLKHIPDPPPFLFVRGSIHALNQPQIAMVGSRKPSQSGYQIAAQFAQALAQQGFVLTSGLAHGIDASAHQGALQAGQGQTIAVMGTGVNLCYPSANQPLYWKIIASGGAVISEFMPNTAAREYHFPRRNRIVSGLSLGVLVVEAALKSGSLITAQNALEQNRQVFAVPGHIYNEQSRGCHQLIRDGALLVDDPQQIVDELDLPRRWHLQEQQHAQNLPQQIIAPEAHTVASQASAQHKAKSAGSVDPASVALAPALEVSAHLQPVYQTLDWVGISLDDLVDRIAIDVATLTSHLMELELLGFAVQQGGLYLRCRQ
ncbi:DNA-processing protein DprA [Alkanindiges illinoisensis]|uniref:DNA-protecting protein DprA n=1 Tax=Alkanindiges illinoisensis TaxID=197183 RepID=A0A4Y7X9I1_9GAMM|nr:DNA-processing protein DprA [Alkanindiges illinoisensis]TEU24183.1 DNA-protecting protein DprA [Alkanindiges illinoisensis]